MISLKSYNHLKASSLVETVIALTICAACLAIAILVFVQISMHSKGITQIKATQQVDELMYQDWLTSESIDDDRITYPEYTFSRSKKAHTENNEWSEIQYIMNFRQQEVIKSMLIFNSHE